MADPVQVWRLCDGRRGHENQSLGLIEALARRVAVARSDLALRGGLASALDALRGPASGASPALVVGAGHATHIALIVAARRHRARSVVLMNPSVPRALFDLCIVPAHDGVAEGGNVLVSLGALNRVRPSSAREPSLALVLLGGPSRHHGWSEGAIVDQVRAIVASAPDLDWIVVASPRTPLGTLATLAGMPRLRLQPFDAGDADWLPERLARAGRVWVTEDSVSMAYEAVSSGAPTGILEVPRLRSARVQRALDALEHAGLVTTMARWRAGHELTPPPAPLQEADRCAAAVLERWPDLAA